MDSHEEDEIEIIVPIIINMKNIGFNWRIKKEKKSIIEV